ncbi:MAG: ATP-binding protein [Cytophagaceae bacterium]
MKHPTDSPSKNKIADLQQQNEDFQNFFQSTIIPQLFFDRNLILGMFSPAAMKQFNLGPKSTGKHLNELSNNLNYHRLEEDIQKTISQRQIIEKEIQTSDGRWYRMNVLPYFNKKEQVVDGAIVTFVDINNYVRSLKELHKLNSEHETFIYSVAHDLKAPLQNIDGLINALNESIKANNSEDIDHIQGMLKSSATKMKDMISDLGKISRDKACNKTQIRFSDLIDEIYLILKENIYKANGKISYDLEVDELIFSRKDLRSILYNLLSNAVKYRSEERKLDIHVKTRREGEFILLSVKDNGRGIEEDKKETIFSLFTRVLDNVEGTGIGLYLVSKLVDAHEGKIIVNSKVNEGSEFLVYLKV